jgi:nitroreductase
LINQTKTFETMMSFNVEKKSTRTPKLDIEYLEWNPSGARTMVLVHGWPDSARTWLATAPVILVCCAEPAKAWCRRDGKNHAEIDVTIAVDHLTLAATEAGLGSCWICAFDAVKVRQLLQIPAHLEPVALILD